MKKILLFASALAGLFLAGSCQRENLEPMESANTVTYTVTVPDALATKGIGDETGNVNTLHYEVYRTAAANTVDFTGADRLLYHKTATAQSDGTFKIELELVNDQNFTVLFWAQVGETNEAYDVTKLTEVKLNSSINANQVDYAAFSGVDFIKATEALVDKTVELKRPVAQVNLGTTEASLKAFNTPITLAGSSVTVAGLSNTFDVASQASGDTFTSTFAYAEKKVPTEKLEVNSTDYVYVGMNYVGFAPAEGTPVTVSYDINTSEGNIQNTIENVPVKPNYRTNIIGNLITSKTAYTIELDNAWGDAGKNMEVLAEGLVKNINGDYEVSTAKGLAYAINNLFVDADGVANAKTFYVKPGLYDMAQQAINDITVTSGTLKVYDTEAVVTRSVAIEGVIITGLSKALIQTVEEDATVFFSGITVTDFNGADDAAALVQNNEGKVVLADCQILDENGAPDLDTELVDGINEPVKVGKGEETAGDLIYTAEQLAAAFAAEEVESIALGADIALDSTLVFPKGRTATLDLRGWELTIADPENVATTYAINNHGTLTIKDSYATGEVNARGIYNGYVDGGDHITDAKLTIESGTFNAMGTNGGAAVYNYGVAEINGGKFQSKGGYGLNSQTGAVMTVNSADVRGGIYNCGTLTVTESKVYQHLSGKHCIYNWQGSVTIESGEFDSKSGNELILADGQNASVVIKGGEFHKTAKSWLYGAATGKDITFTITGGTHYGYVNEPEMTVDTFRPYGDPIVVTGGSYNFDVTNWCAKDYKAVKNAETAVWDVVEKVYVAKIGEDGYESLKEAVAAVPDGETITLVADEIFTETNYYNNGGWKDGLGYSGDKSFTIDLGGYTIKQDGSLNDYLMWVKNDGAKANTITLKNGTMDAGTTAYCALATASSNAQKMTINLENINLINNNSNGAVVKFRGGAELNVKAGTIITGKDSYVGIEAVGNNTVVNVYEGAEIYQNGTTSYVGAIIGASYNATLNIYGGKGKSAKCGIIVMSTGATINVSGGEWTANNDGTVSNDNAGVLVSQNNRYESGWACKSILNVTGGTFKGGYNCWGMGPGQEPDDAQINIKGGNFNANPENYVVAGYEVTENAGTYTVDKPAALKELEAALANGGNVTLTKDVTLLESIKVENKVTLDLNGKTITAPTSSAFEVKTGGDLTIKNGKVVAYESTVRAIGGKVIVDSGEYTSTGTAVDSPATYRYSLDSREGGELIINGGTFKSNNGMINVGSTVTINGGKFENIVEKSMTRHFAYVSAPLTINDGEFYGKANSSAGGCFFCGAAAGGDIQVNGGKFTSLWTSGSVNKIFESYYGGTITVTGGLFNTNGGIATFVTENTDEATKAAYPYVAK